MKIILIWLSSTSRRVSWKRLPGDGFFISSFDSIEEVFIVAEGSVAHYSKCKLTFPFVIINVSLRRVRTVSITMRNIKCKDARNNQPTLLKLPLTMMI